MRQRSGRTGTAGHGSPGRGACLVLASSLLALGGHCPYYFTVEVAGSYTLVSVDGEPLPVAADESAELTRGEIRFGSDHECSMQLTYTSGVENDTCTWSRAGSTLTVRWEERGIRFMTWMDGRITGTLDDREFLFEK